MNDGPGPNTDADVDGEADADADAGTQPEAASRDGSEPDKRERRLEEREMGLDRRSEELDDREQELDDRERELDEREDELANRRQNLREWEARLERREQELDDRKKRIEEAEEELSERATELNEHEETLHNYIQGQVDDLETDVQETMWAALDSYEPDEEGGRLGPAGSFLVGLAGLVVAAAGAGFGTAVAFGVSPGVVGTTTADTAVAGVLLVVGLAVNLLSVADRL